MASGTIPLMKAKTLGAPTIATRVVAASSTWYLHFNANVMVYNDRGGMWTAGNSSSRPLTEIHGGGATVTRQSSTVLKIVGGGSETRFQAFGDGDIYFDQSAT